MTTILTDYAEVLSLPFDRGALVQLAHRLDMDETTLERRYWNLRAPYDLGQSSTDYWNAVVGPGRHLTETEVADLVSIDMAGWLHLNPHALEWLETLVAHGLRPHMLSNAPHPLADAVEASELAPYFDRMLFSARLGAAKPSQTCFALAEQALGVSREHILFLDDRSVNVHAATQFGMNALLFTGEFPVIS